jgi:hypothetical protein
MASLYDWIDDRAGVKRISRAILDEPIRGGARFAYVFGSALLFFCTGSHRIFRDVLRLRLTTHTPASLYREGCTMGRIVRGLHYYGASAMILTVATFANILLRYKPRRTAVDRWRHHDVGRLGLRLPDTCCRGSDAYFGTRWGPGGGEVRSRAS